METFALIEVSKLVVEDHFSLKQMEPEMYKNLKESIEKHGILDPLHVHPLEDGTFKILDGRHRLRVAKELGLSTVPCIIETSEDPAVRLAHVYDIEVIRKHYTYDECIKYLKDKLTEQERIEKKFISKLIEKGLPEELIRKVAGDASINSLAKLERIVSFINRKNSEKISQLEEELNTLRLEKEKDQLELKRLKEEIDKKEKLIKQIGEEFKEKLEKKVNEKLMELNATGKNSKNTLSESEIEELREKIKAELIEKQEDEINKLREEIDESRSNLQELSRKLDESNRKIRDLEREKRELEKKLDNAQKEKENLNTVKVLIRERLNKLSSFSSIQDKLKQIASELEILKNLILAHRENDGFEELELAEVKGEISKLRTKLDAISDLLRQIEPVRISELLLESGMPKN